MVRDAKGNIGSGNLSSFLRRPSIQYACHKSGYAFTFVITHPAVFRAPFIPRA